MRLSLDEEVTILLSRIAEYKNSEIEVKDVLDVLYSIVKKFEEGL